jgi:putative phage-type endonuclease
MNLVQGTPAWLKWREGHIGASEVACILGESDFQSAYELWLVKTKQKSGFLGNYATQRGQDAEPKIRALYEEQASIKLTSPVMEYPYWPVLSASLDGYSEEMKLVVEFKYPSKAKHEMAERGQVPATYRAQIQAQLLVSGCQTAHYVSYDGRDIAVVVVKEDKDYQARILAACQLFWGLVETKTPPPGAPVFLESDTLETLAERYKHLDRIANQTDDEMKLIRQKLDELVAEDKAKFYGLSLTRTERIGAVDYAKIPELHGVDLNQYRKSPSKVLTIKVAE